MKLPLRVLSVAALCIVCATASQAQNWMEPYNRLLGKYVTAGGVKYAEWKNNAADMQALQAVVDGIAREEVSGLDKRQQLAFYINAYNAWILHEALGKYPTTSVQDSTFFTAKKVTVAGQKTSFNALEKETIRSQFGEPRVHFALNCASRSCPPLNREAFSSLKLEEQLEKLAKEYVNSAKGVRFSDETQGKAVQFSKIFDWYKDDFKAPGGVLAFINKRRATPIPNDAKISYQDYDWGLNEVK